MLGSIPPTHEAQLPRTPRYGVLPSEWPKETIPALVLSIYAGIVTLLRMFEKSAGTASSKMTAGMGLVVEISRSLAFSAIEMLEPATRTRNRRSTPTLSLKTSAPVPTLLAVFASPLELAAISTSFVFSVIVTLEPALIVRNRSAVPTLSLKTSASPPTFVPVFASPPETVRLEMAGRTVSHPSVLTRPSP